MPPHTSSITLSYLNGGLMTDSWDITLCVLACACANVFSELARCQSNLTELSRLLQSLEILQRTQSAPNFTEMQVKSTHTLTHTCTHQRSQRHARAYKDRKIRCCVLSIDSAMQFVFHRLWFHSAIQCEMCGCSVCVCALSVGLCVCGDAQMLLTMRLSIPQSSPALLAEPGCIEPWVYLVIPACCSPSDHYLLDCVFFYPFQALG